MLAHINYLHVLVATIAYFVIGALWYSLLFGKVWMVLVNVIPTDDDKKKAPLMFATTLLLNFITATTIACVIYIAHTHSIIVSIKIGAMLGLGFVFAPTIMTNMYAKRPFKLTAIDASYHFIGIIVVSVILAIWR